MKPLSMKRKLRTLYHYFRGKYRMHNSTKAFDHRYKNYNQDLFKKTLDNQTLKKYREKWKVYGEKVEIKTFLLCYNLSKKIDYNIVPENFFAAIIERKLNPYKELSFFSVKNMYQKWFEEDDVFPRSYFHKIDNIYYDPEFSIIQNIGNYIDKIELQFPVLIKPSKDSSGGKGVKLLRDENELKQIIIEYQNI